MDKKNRLGIPADQQTFGHLIYDQGSPAEQNGFTNKSCWSNWLSIHFFLNKT